MEAMPSDCGTWLELQQDPCGYTLMYRQQKDRTYLEPLDCEEAEDPWRGDYDDDQYYDEPDVEVKSSSVSESGESSTESGTASDTSGSHCSEDCKEDADYRELGACQYCCEAPQNLKWFPNDRQLKKGWACEECVDQDFEDLVESAPECMRH